MPNPPINPTSQSSHLITLKNLALFLKSHSSLYQISSSSSSIFTSPSKSPGKSKKDPKFSAKRAAIILENEGFSQNTSTSIALLTELTSHSLIIASLGTAGKSDVLERRYRFSTNLKILPGDVEEVPVPVSTRSNIEVEKKKRAGTVVNNSNIAFSSTNVIVIVCWVLFLYLYKNSWFDYSRVVNAWKLLKKDMSVERTIGISLICCCISLGLNLKYNSSPSSRSKESNNLKDKEESLPIATLISTSDYSGSSKEELIAAPGDEPNIQSLPSIKPSELLKSLQEIINVYLPTYRYIEAGRLYVQITYLLSTLELNGSIRITCNDYVKENQYVFTDCYRRYKLAYDGLQLLSDEKDWKYYKTEAASGTILHNKIDADGNLWIKVESTLTAKIESVTAIWKEGSLYSTWFPMCMFSDVLKVYSDVEIVFKYGGRGGFPGSTSEMVIHGWGVNHLIDGFFFILGGSVTQFPDAENNDIPKSGFMTIRQWVECMSVSIRPVSKTEIQNVLVCCIKLPGLPNFILEWILGKVFLLLFYNMSVAVKATEEVGSKNKHRIRIDENPWYRDFMGRYVNEYMKKMGWE